MVLKRLVIGLVIVFVVLPLLLLTGAGLFLTYGDLSQFKPQLEEAISEATGREFRISGTFEPQVLPMLSVVAEDVTLTNADWSESLMQAEVGRLAAKVDLWELWSGRIAIQELGLRDVDVLIETHTDGRSNTTFETSSSDDFDTTDNEKTDSGPLNIDLAEAELSNLRIVLRSPDVRDTVITIEALAASTDASGHLVINGKTAIDGHQLSADGSVGPLNALLSAKSVEVDLTGTLELVDLPELPYSLATTFTLDNEILQANSLAATLGDSDISGALTMALNDQPRITGEIRSQLIDLTTFEGAPEPTSETAKTSGKLIFVDEPLDYAALRTSNIDIDASIDELRSSAQNLNAIVLSAQLADGILTLSNQFEVPAGGTAKGSAQLNAAAEPAKLSLRFDVNDLRANLISGEGTAAENTPPISVSIDVASQGSSPRALAAASTGSVRFEQGAGRIDNKLLEKVSSDLIAQLLNALNPFAKQEAYSNLECTRVALEFTDGLGTFKELVVQGEKLQILGEGTIDLNSEEISIKFNTKPRDGLGISADMLITPFVRVAGTLAEPSVGLNKTGAALTTGGAIATGGLTILAQSVADRVTAEKDRCAPR